MYNFSTICNSLSRLIPRLTTLGARTAASHTVRDVRMNEGRKRVNIDHKFAFAWNVENARVSDDRTDSIPILINMVKLYGAVATVGWCNRRRHRQHQQSHQSCTSRFVSFVRFQTQAHGAHIVNVKCFSLILIYVKCWAGSGSGGASSQLLWLDYRLGICYLLQYEIIRRVVIYYYFFYYASVSFVLSCATVLLFHSPGEGYATNLIKSSHRPNSIE